MESDYSQDLEDVSGEGSLQQYSEDPMDEYTPVEYTQEEEVTLDVSSTFTAMMDVEKEIERDFGIPIQDGEIDAWFYNADNSHSVIVSYVNADQQIARVEPRLIDTKRVPFLMDQFRIEEKNQWTKSRIKGYGLVAWRVDWPYKSDPTSVLRPMEGAYYPETYIAIMWDDSHWTWESREAFQTLTNKKMTADIIIYKRATAFEARYQEKLTGIIPEYPIKFLMQNTYWRKALEEKDIPNNTTYASENIEKEGRRPNKQNSDLAMLRGLEVSDGGVVFDEFDEIVGHVVEGDVDCLIGYIIDHNGEILDEDGELVGRVELAEHDIGFSNLDEINQT